MMTTYDVWVVQDSNNSFQMLRVMGCDYDNKLDLDFSDRQDKPLMVFPTKDDAKAYMCEVYGDNYDKRFLFNRMKMTLTGF